MGSSRTRRQLHSARISRRKGLLRHHLPSPQSGTNSAKKRWLGSQLQQTLPVRFVTKNVAKYVLDASPAPSPQSSPRVLSDSHNGAVEPPARKAKPTLTKEQLLALAAEADEDDEGVLLIEYRQTYLTCQKCLTCLMSLLPLFPPEPRSPS